MKNSGTLIINTIRPYDSTDTYPVALSNELSGGYYQVATIADRNNISALRRAEGMVCWVVADNTLYQLIGGTDNANWVVNPQTTKIEYLSSIIDSNYSTLQSEVTALSSYTINLYTTVNNTSANWNSVYTTVQNNSSTTWNYQGTDLKALSANWENTYTTVLNNSSTTWLGDSAVDALVHNTSGNWDSVYTNVNSNSANWENTYTTVLNNSATTWNYQGTDLKALSAGWTDAQTIVNNTSGNWNNVFTTVQNNSATTWLGDAAVDTLVHNTSGNWNSVYTTVNNTSSNWENTYTTVLNNSATTWNYQGTDLKALSANWETTYTTVQNNSATTWLGDAAVDTLVHSNSGNWETTYTIVNSNSGTWQTALQPNTNVILTSLSALSVSANSFELGGVSLSAWPTNANWGNITGTLSAQTDLYSNLQTLSGRDDLAVDTLVRSSSATWTSGATLSSVYAKLDGTNQPFTGTVQLRTGSATSGTAPIKFTTGTLLSTPETGAIEFNTDDYYATLSSSGSATSNYPPAQNGTYVKATSYYSAGYEPYLTTDPSKSLIGSWYLNAWVSGNAQTTNQRFHIDLGTSIIIDKIYYENGHLSGIRTSAGVNNFTFWGSNSSSDFNDTTYANNGSWVQLSTNVSQFSQHTGSDIPDPKYITVTNTTAYRYYAFKFADCYGDGSSMSVRRIELQQTGTKIRSKIILDNGTSLTNGRIPFSTTNGRLNDSSTLTYSSTTGLATTKPNIITGSSDTTQFKVIANATQTSNLIDVFASDGITPRLHLTGGGNLGIGTTSPTYKLDVNASSTDHTLATGSAKFYSVKTISSNDATQSAGIAVQSAWVGSANYTGVISSLYGNNYYSGTGTMTTQNGLWFIVGTTGDDTGTVDTRNGVSIQVFSTSAKAVTNSYGLRVQNMAAYNSPTNTAGVMIDTSTTAVGTNKYGILIGNQSGATNNYAIKTGTGTVSFGANTTITGSSDAVQFKVIQNATQTNDVFQILASDGTTARLSQDSKGYVKIINSTGANNVMILGGTNGVPASQTGNYNTVMGDKAFKAATSGASNSIFGYNAGALLNSGGSNIFIGANAGNRQTTVSNILLIDNQDRTTAGNELTQSLIYGVFNATPANQTLTTNVGTFAVAGGGTAQSTIAYGLAINTAAGSGVASIFNVKGSSDQYLITTDVTNNRVGIGTGSPTTKLDVAGTVNLGSASTDTITHTGRMIVRTLLADPTANATAGTIAEIAYYNNKFYGKITTTGTDTNWSALN